MSARLASRAVIDRERAALIERFGNRCMICGRPPKTRALSVDHDHTTGAVRGLLCHGCNRKLWPGASVDWLNRAANYIANSPALDGESAAREDATR